MSFSKIDSTTPEIWAGVECTVNRVDDRFVDQCAKNGHNDRPEDIKLFAELGIKRIRYPVLWEKVVRSDNPEVRDWDLSDERLQLLREHDLKPIVGLVHHGSGPSFTSLLDTEFPEKLARYARSVAERYPWVDAYTPINEPLTTARFSGLYGVWYPHGRDNKTFIRCLVTELKATVLAIRAIREISPDAKLVMTDDMGRAQGSEILKYQIDFENERRFLSFDLIMGKVVPTHPLYLWLQKHAEMTLEDLQWFQENAMTPDLIGINHYPLSNRFLDHRLELYPKMFHGGNGIHQYADVGAVDTGQCEPPTPESIYRDVWERYHLPFVVTEAHIAGGRESQIRWLNEVWQSAKKLRSEGCDIRAVTAWSLLGSYDWNSLCSRCDNFYESGVFDIRSTTPRPTALASMIQSFARGEDHAHPVLERPGYWREPLRVLFAPKDSIVSASATFAEVPGMNPQLTHTVAIPVDVAAERATRRRPILITGATGTLGRAFARICETRGLDYKLVSRNEMDIASRESIESALEGLRPWAVINTAGYVRVDDAETEIERCRRENAVGPRLLAESCAAHQIPFLTFSSDLVFDGAKNAPYVETDLVSPLNVYGRTKAEAEIGALETWHRALVVRTSAFFGPWDEYNFPVAALRTVKEGRAYAAAHDLIVSPTYVPDLVNTCLDLLIDGERGILHLANRGALTWADWAKLVARRAGHDDSVIESVSYTSMSLKAPRPRFAALASERMDVMPSFEDSMDRFFHELKKSGIDAREEMI